MKIEDQIKITREFMLFRAHFNMSMNLAKDMMEQLDKPFSRMRKLAERAHAELEAHLENVVSDAAIEAVAEEIAEAQGEGESGREQG